MNQHGDRSFKLEIQKTSVTFGLPAIAALFVGAIMDASTVLHIHKSRSSLKLLINLGPKQIVKRKKKNTQEIPRNACIISIAFGISYVIFIVLMNITGLAIEIRAFALVIGLMLINIFRIPTYLKFAFKKNEHNQKRTSSVKKQRILRTISAESKRQSLKRIDPTDSFLNIQAQNKPINSGKVLKIPRGPQGIGFVSLDPRGMLNCHSSIPRFFEE